MIYFNSAIPSIPLPFINFDLKDAVKPPVKRFQSPIAENELSS